MSDPIARRGIKTAFWIGDTVYHRGHLERIPGLVVGVYVDSYGHKYRVAWNNENRAWHYELELTNEFLVDYGSHQKDE